MEELKVLSEITFESNDSFLILCDFENRKITYHDELLIVFKNADKELPLGTGNVISIVDDLHEAMLNIQSKSDKMLIDFEFSFQKGLGYYYNLYSFAENGQFDSNFQNKHYFLYGGNADKDNPYLCLIYGYNDSFFLEVSKLFPDNEDQDFAAWIANEYSIESRFIISSHDCQSVKVKCETILKNISDFNWDG